MPTTTKPRSTSSRKRKPSSSSSSGGAKPSSSGSSPKVDDTVIAAGRPLLVGGCAGPDVIELCRLLGELGHETTVSRGENAFGVLDESVINAVNAARDELGVKDERLQHHDPRTTVGVQTWAALIRATA